MSGSERLDGDAVTRLTCREAAHRLALDAPADEGLSRHLADCPPCAAFEQQLTLVTAAARAACQRYEAELPSDFEARLLRHLCR
jgi:hypothetical protein